MAEFDDRVARLRQAATWVRENRWEGMLEETGEALAMMLENEARIREAQPRGFYEVQDADVLADTIIPEEQP